MMMFPPSNRLPTVFVRLRRRNGELNRVGIVRRNGLHRCAGLLAPARGQHSAYRNLLYRIGVIADKQGNPQRIARCNLRLRRVQISEMLDVVRWPKGPIEGPGSTQLKGQLCRWWLITTSPDIPNGSWRDTFEDVTRGCAADQRLSENETDGGLGEFFELCVGKIVLRLVVTPGFCGHLRIGNLPRRRNFVGAIFRTFALEEIEV